MAALRMATLRRIGCLFIPHLSAAVAIRAEPALQGRPVVILSQTAPVRVVIEASPEARAQGIKPGMTEAEILSQPRRGQSQRSGAPPAPVFCRERVPAMEEAAQQDLLQVALTHSPRVEDGGAGVVYLDVSGLGGLFGNDPEIAARLSRCADDLGLPVRVGIAGSRAGALSAARWSAADPRPADSILHADFILQPGQEENYLAPAPLGLLDLSPEMAERLRRWGIRTLGELAALPPSPLFERLGSEGRNLQALARGEDPRPLRLHAPPEVFEESRELEWTVETIEHLVKILARLAERLCARLERRQLTADGFTWSCRLADGTTHEVDLTPAVPMNEAIAVTALIRASLQSRPPQSPVEAVILRARPVRVSPAQDSLTDRSRPSPRVLTTTLARVAALVGEPQMGVAILIDSHRLDAVRLEPFVLSPARGRAKSVVPSGVSARGVLALRRLRPPLRARVRMDSGRPVEIDSTRLAGKIVSYAGPWRASGEWWTKESFFHDEWDVELGDGTLCRLGHDGRVWWLEGVYD